jgi:hypothetical protein
MNLNTNGNFQFCFFNKERWKSTIGKNETQYNKKLFIWKNDMYNHTMWAMAIE